MNVTTALGFVSAILVFLGTVFFSFKNVDAILDFRSAFMVFGGTIAVALICFPAKEILKLFRVFLRRMLGKNRRNYMEVVAEISALSAAHRQGKKQFQAAIKNIQDPFLKDAAGVLFWASSEVSEEKLRKLLETRAFTHYNEYLGEAEIFRTIAKFPPAFGLMGTTLGMIALLQSLSGGDDAKGLLGTAMAIALVTTLYGLALSNFILVPIAENLTKQTEEDRKSRFMVVEGIMLIHEQMPTKYVEEHVKSFLLPSQRGGEAA